MGAGPAGLMAAEVMASGGADITVYEGCRRSDGNSCWRAGWPESHSPARNSISSSRAMGRRRRACARDRGLSPRLCAPGPRSGQKLCRTSGRVFPKSLKTSPLLRAWLQRLDQLGVRFALRHRWLGWDEGGDIIFDAPAGHVTVPADAVVLALGGASWPRLGSDGGWVDILRKAGVALAPLRPSNCAFAVNWSDIFRDRFEGQPLKRIALSFGGKTVRGEAVVTRDGLEVAPSMRCRRRCGKRIAESGGRSHRRAAPDVSSAGLRNGWRRRAASSHYQCAAQGRRSSRLRSACCTRPAAASSQNSAP